MDPAPLLLQLRENRTDRKVIFKNVYFRRKPVGSASPGAAAVKVQSPPGPKGGQGRTKARAQCALLRRGLTGLDPPCSEPGKTAAWVAARPAAEGRGPERLPTARGPQPRAPPRAGPGTELGPRRAPAPSAAILAGTVAGLKDDVTATGRGKEGARKELELRGGGASGLCWWAAEEGLLGEEGKWWRCPLGQAGPL